jgi:hypothetical protein
MVMGVTAASSAFLAQRDLQADCDGAATKAANAFGGATQEERTSLPLVLEAARRAVDHYRQDLYGEDTSAAMSVDAGDETIIVTCTRVVHVPFGTVFGLGGGVQRSAWSTARSPFADDEASEQPEHSPPGEYG